MKRRLKGKVVSNKMTKTLVVAVDRIKEHPLYKKKFKVTNNFKVHVENEKEFQVGQEVVVEETRPISKDKRWIVVEEKKENRKENEEEKKKK